MYFTQRVEFWKLHCCCNLSFVAQKAFLSLCTVVPFLFTDYHLRDIDNLWFGVMEQKFYKNGSYNKIIKIVIRFNNQTVVDDMDSQNQNGKENLKRM